MALARADLVEQRRHVGHRQRFAIGRGIVGIIGLAVAAHVPQDELVMFRQRLDLALPHRRCRRIAVGQHQRRSAAVDLVIDLDPVTIDFWHRGFPTRSVATLERYPERDPLRRMGNAPNFAGEAPIAAFAERGQIRDLTSFCRNAQRLWTDFLARTNSIYIASRTDPDHSARQVGIDPVGARPLPNK